MQINIGFCASNVFSQHCGVTLTSILKNSSLNDDYRIFIITSDMSDENKAKFEELKKIRDFEIQFINIDDKNFRKLNIDKRICVESFYRFHFFSFKEIDKLLYIDSDIVARKDIAEIYNINIEDYCLAGVEDISNEISKRNIRLLSENTYINAGLLLINLKKTREVDHFEFLQNLPEVFQDKEFSDQDLINHIYQGKILLMDIKYNFVYPFYNSYRDQDYYHSCASNPYCVHHITHDKPWNPNSTAYKKEEYFKYLKMTPWYDEFMETYRIEEKMEILGKLNNVSDKLDDASNKLNEVLVNFNRRM